MEQLIYKIILIYFVLGGIGFYLINRKKIGMWHEKATQNLEFIL